MQILYVITLSMFPRKVQGYRHTVDQNAFPTCDSVHWRLYYARLIVSVKVHYRYIWHWHIINTRAIILVGENCCCNGYNEITWWLSIPIWWNSHIFFLSVHVSACPHLSKSTPLCILGTFGIYNNACVYFLILIVKITRSRIPHRWWHCLLYCVSCQVGMQPASWCLPQVCFCETKWKGFATTEAKLSQLTHQLFYLNVLPFWICHATWNLIRFIYKFWWLRIKWTETRPREMEDSNTR